MDHTSDVKPPLKKQHSSTIHQVMRLHVWSSLTCAFKFVSVVHLCLCRIWLPSYKDLRARINRRITTLREASLLQGAHNLERGYEVNGSHRLMARAHLQSHIIDAYSCIAKRLHSHAYSAVLILQNERVSLCWWIEVFEGFAPGWKSIDGTTPKRYSLARRSNRREWRHLP